MVEACDAIDGIRVVDSEVHQREVPGTMFEAMIGEGATETHLVVVARLDEESETETFDDEAAEIHFDDEAEDEERERVPA